MLIAGTRLEESAMKRAITLLMVGAAAGLAIDRVVSELRKPAPDQFPWLRRQVNERVNPWLLEHHIPGSSRAEIATLEHVGRVSGITHYTPVHPTLRDDRVLIPAPLGVGSQWALNILQAGVARMQLHDHLYDLDRPELITVAETGLFPPPLAAPFDGMGWRYLRLHVAGTTPGAFAVTGTSSEPDAGAILPATGVGDVPREPRMVDREVVPA